MKEQIVLLVTRQIIDYTHQSICSIQKIRDMFMIIDSNVEVPALGI